MALLIEKYIQFLEPAAGQAAGNQQTPHVLQGDCDNFQSTKR
jgi:hypothetical protein